MEAFCDCGENTELGARETLSVPLSGEAGLFIDACMARYCASGESGDSTEREGKAEDAGTGDIAARSAAGLVLFCGLEKRRDTLARISLAFFLGEGLLVSPATDALVLLLLELLELLPPCPTLERNGLDGASLLDERACARACVFTCAENGDAAGLA